MTLQIKCGPVTDTQSCNDKCIQNTISNGSIHIAGRKSIPMVQFDIADSISKRFGFPGNSQPWTIWRNFGSGEILNPMCNPGITISLLTILRIPD